VTANRAADPVIAVGMQVDADSYRASTNHFRTLTSNSTTTIVRL